jgi:hypothetical protein
MSAKTKKCGRCRKFKALKEFGGDKREADGMNRTCKKCRNSSKRIPKKDEEIIEEETSQKMDIRTTFIDDIHKIMKHSEAILDTAAMEEDPIYRSMNGSLIIQDQLATIISLAQEAQRKRRDIDNPPQLEFLITPDQLSPAFCRQSPLPDQLAQEKNIKN